MNINVIFIFAIMWSVLSLAMGIISLCAGVIALISALVRHDKEKKSK